MIVFERTVDPGIVRRIVTHPSVWPHISDDGMDPEAYMPSPRAWYVVAKLDKKELGLFIAVPVNCICYEVHACLLPDASGLLAAHAYKQALEWFWRNSEARKLVTWIRTVNRRGIRLAEWAGFAQRGVLMRALKKDGQLLNIAVLDMDRPAEINQ